jgi:hypothetical membrane protein
VKLSAASSLAGVVAPLWFSALVVLQGWWNPDYSHVRLPISALAAWPTGWMQNVNFYVTGALVIVAAAGLHAGIRPGPTGAAGPLLLVGGGAGIIIAGIFPWHMVNGVPTETPAHVVGAVMTFVCTGLGFVVLSRRLISDARWHDLAAYSRATGVSVLLLFVLLAFFAIQAGSPLHNWAGLLQRVLCAIWFAYLITVSFRLRAVATRAIPSRG